MTTRLHYSDVLTGSDGRLVSFDGVDGMYRVYDAVLGGYDGWLKDTLKDKTVLAVAVGAKP